MTSAVLIIEDEKILGKNMLHYLQRSGWEVQLAETATAGLMLFESFRPDVVVLDFNLPDHDGMHVLGRLRALDPNVRVIMVTGHGTVELAVQAMRCGALDFLTKPVSLGQLRMQVEKALGEDRRDSALRYYRDRDAGSASLDALIGDSAPMRALKRTLEQMVQAEAQLRDAEAPAVLVLGETGTGKEVVARALHQAGARRARPFVELNCAALPAQLLESELFGHERGAFTDARERKLGLVETAEGGTLFLDEIGDMDLALQAKLLKLLEEKTVRRLGSVREQRVSVRIVAATHRPLETLVREGRFRADLYYRLCVLQVRLPALRERGDDILLLARHFIGLHAARYGKPVPALSPQAEALLTSHGWPGNVRELRNVIEQAVLMSNEPQLQAASFGLLAGSPRDEATAASSIPEAATLPEIERQTLLRALQHNAWNVSRTARTLGISRDTLRYRIEKHGLNDELRPAFTDSVR